MELTSNIGNTLNDYERVKFNSKPAKKAKKIIKKALVLNELERKKAEGIRGRISGVLEFIKSGSPKLPRFTGKGGFFDTFANAEVFHKIIMVPALILYLPLVAAKMGINTAKLAKLMLDKKEILNDLKAQHLDDNIERFANQERTKYSKEGYIEHLQDNKTGEFNDLIDEMSKEISGGRSRWQMI